MLDDFRVTSGASTIQYFPLDDDLVLVRSVASLDDGTLPGLLRPVGEAGASELVSHLHYAERLADTGPATNPVTFADRCRALLQSSIA